MEKRCFVCGVVKPLDAFYAHPKTTDRHLGKCKECTKRYMRERDTREIDKRRYRTNPDRYLKHKYYMMKRRVEGKTNHQSYNGKEIMSFDEWTKWNIEVAPIFDALFKAWVESGWDRNRAPSIDRIDSSKGYTIDNVQWLTTHENTIKH